ALIATATSSALAIPDTFEDRPSDDSRNLINVSLTGIEARHLSGSRCRRRCLCTGTITATATATVVRGPDLQVGADTVPERVRCWQIGVGMRAKRYRGYRG